MDLEEDYESIYRNGWRPDPYGARTIPVGLCTNMCPYEEMQERERNKRLSKYEIEPDTNPPKVSYKLAIKEYKRSCVGKEFAASMDLRPWSVLRHTLHHLLLNICLEHDDWMFICDFVFDRLKALRQDMVIQRIEGKRYIEVLEGSIRFCIYSMYKLTCTLKDYTISDLSKPIITLDGQLGGLNNYEMNILREMKLTMQCLRDCLRTLIIQYQENVPDSINRSLFESINLIVNLPFSYGHCSSSTDFQAKSELRNSDENFKTVFRMFREHLSGNHLTALKRLPILADKPLLLLSYAPVLAQLQVHMMQILRKSYAASGSNTATLKQLCAIICPEWLHSNEEERLLFGKLLAVQFGIFDKKREICDFKQDKKVRLPRDFVEKALFERQREKASYQGDNETRIYALQMIVGKDWSLFHDAIESHGLECILDTNARYIES